MNFTYESLIQDAEKVAKEMKIFQRSIAQKVKDAKNRMTEDDREFLNQARVESSNGRDDMGIEGLFSQFETVEDAINGFRYAPLIDPVPVNKLYDPLTQDDSFIANFVRVEADLLEVPLHAVSECVLHIENAGHVIRLRADGDYVPVTITKITPSHDSVLLRLHTQYVDGLPSVTPPLFVAGPVVCAVKSAAGYHPVTLWSVGSGRFRSEHPFNLNLGEGWSGVAAESNGKAIARLVGEHFDDGVPVALEWVECSDSFERKMALLSSVGNQFVYLRKSRNPPRFTDEAYRQMRLDGTIKRRSRAPDREEFSSDLDFESQVEDRFYEDGDDEIVVSSKFRHLMPDDFSANARERRTGDSREHHRVGENRHAGYVYEGRGQFFEYSKPSGARASFQMYGKKSKAKKAANREAAALSAFTQTVLEEPEMPVLEREDLYEEFTPRSPSPEPASPVIEESGNASVVSETPVKSDPSVGFGGVVETKFFESQTSKWVMPKRHPAELKVQFFGRTGQPHYKGDPESSDDELELIEVCEVVEEISPELQTILKSNPPKPGTPEFRAMVLATMDVPLTRSVSPTPTPAASPVVVPRSPVPAPVIAQPATVAPASPVPATVSTYAQLARVPTLEVRAEPQTQRLASEALKAVNRENPVEAMAALGVSTVPAPTQKVIPRLPLNTVDVKAPDAVRQVKELRLREEINQLHDIIDEYKSRGVTLEKIITLAPDESQNLEGFHLDKAHLQKIAAAYKKRDTFLKMKKIREEADRKQRDRVQKSVDLLTSQLSVSNSKLAALKAANPDFQ